MARASTASGSTSRTGIDSSMDGRRRSFNPIYLSPSNPARHIPIHHPSVGSIHCFRRPRAYETGFICLKTTREAFQSFTPNRPSLRPFPSRYPKRISRLRYNGHGCTRTVTACQNAEHVGLEERSARRHSSSAGADQEGSCADRGDTAGEFLNAYCSTLPLQSCITCTAVYPSRHTHRASDALVRKPLLMLIMTFAEHKSWCCNC